MRSYGLLYGSAAQPGQKVRPVGVEVQAGVPVTEVAERFGVSRQAVHRWRRWYEDEAISPLYRWRLEQFLPEAAKAANGRGRVPAVRRLVRRGADSRVR